MGIEATLLFVLAAVAVVVVVHWLDDRTGLPAAALLTLVGIGYALLPGPNIALDPHLVLTVVLPPLLYSAALDSSLLAIRRNLRTVVSLSVVLVLVTAVLIGVGFGLFVAGATRGGRDRPRRRRRPAGPGRRARRRAAGRAAAAADHADPGRGPAQRRDRPHHAHRGGRGGPGWRLLGVVGAGAVPAGRGRRRGRAGWPSPWASAAAALARGDPMALNAVSLATPFGAYLARRASCTSPACSPSSSPGWSSGTTARGWSPGPAGCRSTRSGG